MPEHQNLEAAYYDRRLARRGVAVSLDPEEVGERINEAGLRVGVPGPVRISGEVRLGTRPGAVERFAAADPRRLRTPAPTLYEEAEGVAAEAASDILPPGTVQAMRDFMDRALSPDETAVLRKQLEAHARSAKSPADFTAEEITRIAAAMPPGFNIIMQGAREILAAHGVPVGGQMAVTLALGVMWPAPAFGTPRPVDRPSKS